MGRGEQSSSPVSGNQGRGVEDRAWEELWCWCKGRPSCLRLSRLLMVAGTGECTPPAPHCCRAYSSPLPPAIQFRQCKTLPVHRCCLRGLGGNSGTFKPGSWWLEPTLTLFPPNEVRACVSKGGGHPCMRTYMLLAQE